MRAFAQHCLTNEACLQRGDVGAGTSPKGGGMVRHHGVTWVSDVGRSETHGLPSASLAPLAAPFLFRRELSVLRPPDWTRHGRCLATPFISSLTLRNAQFDTVRDKQTERPPADGTVDISLKLKLTTSRPPSFRLFSD